MVNAIEWCGASLRFLDQTQLPLRETYITTSEFRDVIDAIKSLKVRGAPLIGIAAAYGICLAANSVSSDDYPVFRTTLLSVIDEFEHTRPTAVNLSRATAIMKNVLDRTVSKPEAIRLLIHDALAIHDRERLACRKIGEFGKTLFHREVSLLTHCNTGALATGGEGTALAVIIDVHREGNLKTIYVDETRPLFQGSRLTAWELQQHAISPVVITDSTAGTLMQQKKIDAVMVGADRITQRGDVANKIGTYSLAVLARYHRIPFYVAAPISTIDASIERGGSIPIEERNPQELTMVAGIALAPDDVLVYSPAFDVTPSDLVTGIITEEGVFTFPYDFSHQNTELPE